MAWLLVLLWLGLLAGQLGAIPLGAGVVLYVHDVVLVITLLVASLRYQLIKTVREARLLRPVWLFAAVGAVSILVNSSGHPMEGTIRGSLYLVRWVTYALVYALVLASPVSARAWLAGLGSLGVAFAGLGFVQLILYPDLRNLWYLGWDPHYYRLFATLLDPNFAGIILVLALFVLWHLGWRLAALLVLVALLLTYSRSSYAALLAGIGATLIPRHRWKQWLIITLMLLVGIVYLPKPGGETLLLDRYDSTVARVQNWSQSLARIAGHPLLGLGWGAGKGVDSSFLFVGVGSGIAGSAAYLWLVIEQVKTVLRRRDAPGRFLLLGSLAAVGIHSLFVNSLFYPWVMLWLWALMGIAQKSQRW